MDDTSSHLNALLEALDPLLVEAVPSTLWRKIPPDLASWLLTHTLTSPWHNQLTFAAMVNTLSGIGDPMNSIRSMNSFLRYAVPNIYAELASLDPEQALLSYMNDPVQPRVGRYTYVAYLTLQNKTQRYLDESTSAIRERLKPFLFPTLIVSTRLQKLVKQKRTASARQRKHQVFDVTRNLSTLVALAKRRYQWLVNLENQFQQIARQFKNGEISLPVTITVQHPEQLEQLTFRVWDQFAWVNAHREAYGLNTLSRYKGLKAANATLFLQLESDIPDGVWFLSAVAMDIIQGVRRQRSEACRYADIWQLPNLNVSLPGLLKPGGFGKFLCRARDRATGMPDDSKVIFCVEPLLSAATVGLFVLVSIVSTGMRVGELQQLTYDQACMERGYLPQFDDEKKQWVQGPERTFWRVFPKGGLRRERYLASATALETLLAFHDLHLRYCGSIEMIPAQPDKCRFAHTRRYPDRYRFVLQWAGVHLPAHALNHCLTFLLLEHPCRGQLGNPVRITSHIFRHAVAGWLHQEDFSLEQIMGVLKHVNATVTTYYAALSPDELYRKLGPLLTSLAELAEMDPSTIRSAEQLRNLQEQALKRYGLLRKTPGGTCTTLQPCEVHFKCADCSYYIPDPARRSDVEQMIADGSELIQFYRHNDEHLLADAEYAHQCSWQRVLTEMERIEKHQLLPPQTVADRMRAFPVHAVGPLLMQESNPIQQLED